MVGFRQLSTATRFRAAVRMPTSHITVVALALLLLVSCGVTDSGQQETQTDDTAVVAGSGSGAVTAGAVTADADTADADTDTDTTDPDDQTDTNALPLPAVLGGFLGGGGPGPCEDENYEIASTPQVTNEVAAGGLVSMCFGGLSEGPIDVAVALPDGTETSFVVNLSSTSGVEPGVFPGFDSPSYEAAIELTWVVNDSLPNGDYTVTFSDEGGTEFAAEFRVVTGARPSGYSTHSQLGSASIDFYFWGLNPAGHDLGIYKDSGLSSEDGCDLCNRFDLIEAVTVQPSSRGAAVLWLSPGDLAQGTYCIVPASADISFTTLCDAFGGTWFEVR